MKLSANFLLESVSKQTLKPRALRMGKSVFNYSVTMAAGSHKDPLRAMIQSDNIVILR